MEAARPRLRTPFTRLFGIRHPIACGGLMWLATPAYVAAVARGGALGFLSARTCGTPEALREAIRACRAEAEGNPFGVNLTVTGRPVDDAVLPGLARALVEEGVRAVETAGAPPTVLLPLLKDAGVTVMHKVTTLRHAQSAERLGVDAVAVVGMECGGHPGAELTGSMILGGLVPRRLGIPVVLGGGIGSGRQLVAALAMGAGGVLLGSRMLAADEIPAHDSYKAAVLAADERASTLVMGTMNNLFRVLDNDTARAVAALEAAGERDFEAYRPLARGTLQAEAYASGAIDKGLLSMGPAAAFADRRMPVAAIIDTLLREAAEALDALRTVQAEGWGAAEGAAEGAAS